MTNSGNCKGNTVKPVWEKMLQFEKLMRFQSPKMVLIEQSLFAADHTASACKLRLNAKES
jgi:hypothetical protein